MRRSRFSEEQIIAVLREHDAGVKTADLCPQAWDQRCDLLQLEGQIRRDDGVGGGAATHARGREPPAEEAAGGVDARQRGVEGSPGKKLTRSAERYAAVEKLMADYGFSERRACRLIGVNRSAWQYEPKGDGDASHAQGCVRSRTSGVGLVTGAWRSCSAARACG